MRRPLACSGLRRRRQWPSCLERGSLRFRWSPGLDRLDHLESRKKALCWLGRQQKQSCTDELALFHGEACIEAPLFELRELFVVVPRHREGVAHDLFPFDMLPAVPGSARGKRFHRRCLPVLWFRRDTSSLRSPDYLIAGRCLVGAFVRGCIRAFVALVPGSL